MNLFSQMLVAVAGAGMICGCNDDKKTEQAVGPTSYILPEVVVTPASATLFPGDTFRFRALPGRGQTATDVRWTSSRPELSDVDSLTGLVRAKATGKVTVVARVAADTSVRGAAAVEIIPRP